MDLNPKQTLLLPSVTTIVRALRNNPLKGFAHCDNGSSVSHDNRCHKINIFAPYYVTFNVTHSFEQKSLVRDTYWKIVSTVVVINWDDIYFCQ